MWFAPLTKGLTPTFEKAGRFELETAQKLVRESKAERNLEGIEAPEEIILSVLVIEGEK